MSSRAEVAATCREVAARGVAVGGAGNISVRRDDRVLITRGGLRFETAVADDISVVDLDGTLLEGFRASSETGLHLGIYRSTDAVSVVHTHGRSSVALGLVADEIPLIHYNLLRLGGRVPTVPYATFGSPELAEAVARIFENGFRAALLRNHGAVSAGRSLAEAVENAELTEWLCEIYLCARSVGEPALLSPEDLQDVLAQAHRLSYG